MLVYVVVSKFSIPAVRYVRRPDTATDFATGATAPVTLYTHVNYLASPWLSDDCSRLYVVVGVDVSLNMLEQLTVQ